MTGDILTPPHLFAGVHPSHRALEIGKAAEHLVCADLILSGYRAFLSDQGLPYDIIIDYGGKLLRAQVKSTLEQRQERVGRWTYSAYQFSVRHRGNRRSQRLTNDMCDLVACVALDIRQIAYFPVSVCGQGIRLRAPGSVRSTKGGQRTWARNIDEFPITPALANDFEFYRGAVRQRPKACPQGHLYTDDNTRITKRGCITCIACARAACLRYQRERTQRARDQRGEQKNAA